MAIDQTESTADKRGDLPKWTRNCAGCVGIPLSALLLLMLFVGMCDNGDEYSEWSACEIVWGKISNADIRQDRTEEARLKGLARSLECYMRPESVPLKEYPGIERIPDPTAPE